MWAGSSGKFIEGLTSKGQSISYEDARMVAAKVASKAVEKASALKSASFDFFAQFTQQ